MENTYLRSIIANSLRDSPFNASETPSPGILSPVHLSTGLAAREAMNTSSKQLLEMAKKLEKKGTLFVKDAKSPLLPALKALDLLIKKVEEKPINRPERETLILQKEIAHGNAQIAYALLSEQIADTQEDELGLTLKQALLHDTGRSFIRSATSYLNILKKNKEVFSEEDKTNLQKLNENLTEFRNIQESLIAQIEQRVRFPKAAEEINQQFLETNKDPRQHIEQLKEQISEMEKAGSWASSIKLSPEQQDAYLEEFKRRLNLDDAAVIPQMKAFMQEQDGLLFKRNLKEIFPNSENAEKVFDEMDKIQRSVRKLKSEITATEMQIEKLEREFDLKEKIEQAKTPFNIQRLQSRLTEGIANPKQIERLCDLELEMDLTDSLLKSLEEVTNLLLPNQ